jgi:hypothetical protein
MNSESQLDVSKVVAGILHLGNISKSIRQLLADPSQSFYLQPRLEMLPQKSKTLPISSKPAHC